ncbi:MAG: putative ferredoxin [Firmicutes bacterium]|nr:putative ferredoxin [Bacillota bacterium]
MKIQSLKLVYFSPTGTTKAIIQGIARGINQSAVELIDITKPNARKQQLQTSENELLVVAVPVYMGRVPALLMEWLLRIKAHNTPTVCIVVYGNRVYDDALLELKDTLITCGCLPITCAAYIGEHSFSSSETPTCPVGAIASENSNLIDNEKCITCCACIKNCPQNARTMKTGLVKDAAIRLNTLYQERKEPVFFL